MKLKTKLLPLAGVAIATAAITPFIASCQSKDSYKGNWSWSIEEGDYAPQTAPRAYEKLTAKTQDDVNSAALDMWFDDVAKNYNVFYDDLAVPRYGTSLGSWWQTYMGILPISSEMKITDISKSNHTISFDFTLNAYAMDELYYVDDIEPDGDTVTVYWEPVRDYIFMKTQFSAKLTNIPFAAISESYYGGYIPQIVVDSDAFADLDWNIELSIEQMGSINSYTFDNDNMQPAILFPRIAPWGTFSFFEDEGTVWPGEDPYDWDLGDVYQNNFLDTFILTQYMFSPSYYYYDEYTYTSGLITPYHFQNTYWTLQ